MSERLAQAFVECATEWDWSELPEHVQAPILAAADALEKHGGRVTIVVEAKEDHAEQ